MSNLKYLRKRENLSQTKLAAELGISVQRYNMYELGKRKIPIDIANKLSNVLNSKLEEIFLNYN